MPGDECDGAGAVTVRERDLGTRGRGERSRHAGDDFERDARLTQRLRLLGPAAEDEWVASLQVHDDLSPTNLLNDLPRNVLPALGVGAWKLSDAKALRVRPGKVERAGRSEIVVENKVGLAQNLDGPQSEQARIAGTGADQVRLTHAVICRVGGCFAEPTVGDGGFRKASTHPTGPTRRLPPPPPPAPSTRRAV